MNRFINYLILLVMTRVPHLSHTREITSDLSIFEFMKLVITNIETYESKEREDEDN